MNLYSIISKALQRSIARAHRLSRRQPFLLTAAVASLGFTSPFTPAYAQPLTLVAGFAGIKSINNFPDPIIAAGPASLVLMINSQIAILDKQGTRLFQQDLGGSSGFWKAQRASSSVAEPWVIFDPNSQRFIASAADFGNAKGALYLAVSKTSTPVSSGDWYKYKLDRSATHQNPAFLGVPTYPDNAKVGVDGDALYITSAHFAKDRNITTMFSHVELFAIAKAPLLAGGPLTVVYDEPVITDSYAPYLAFSIHPAIVFEPAPAMHFVQSATRAADDQIVVHTLTDVLNPTATRTVTLVPVAPFDRPPDVPQFGTTALLENIDARLMSATVRQGALWTSHAIVDPSVDAESLVRWYEFDVAGFPGTPVLAQSGNVDPGPGIHTWLPHIAVDSLGNMALGFSVGGAGMHAAIGYTGRLANDPPGSTLPVHIARSGEGYYTQYAWGEYSGLAIDPDGLTFWQFNEYPTAANGWDTYVSAFQLAEPPPPADPLHVGDLDASSANSGKTGWKATVVVTLHDGNEQPVQGATVSIAWINGASGTATGTTGADGKCTFVSATLSKTVASATLTVTGAIHPTLTYGGTNHDPDSDSTGTTIVVPKP